MGSFVYLPTSLPVVFCKKTLPTVYDSTLGNRFRGKDPCATVDEIAALGLRHVGYAVPIELFEPFVEGQLVDLWR